jgi:TRAP-type C4-dicarboxylate transport system permease small subunit
LTYPEYGGYYGLSISKEPDLNFYKKIVNRICDVFELIAAVCLAAMVVAVVIQVVGRYVFSNTPGWSEELPRQFMIIFSFIGLAIGVRYKIHIALTVVVDNLNRKAKLPIEIFGKALILLLGIMMSVNMGPYFTKLRYNRLPGTGLPVGWMYVVPTAIGILTALVAAYQIYDHFKSGTDEEQSPREKIAGQEGYK